MAPRHLRRATIARPMGTLFVGIVLALGLGTFLRVHQPTGVFDQEQLTNGVASVLGGAPPAGYGLVGVTNVECPAEVTVEAGTSFPCSLQIDGSAESVTVLVTGDNQTAQNGGPASGVYEVAAPA